MPVWLVPIIKWLGHWVVYFVLSAIVVWGLYAGLIRPVTKPNPTAVQTGGVSNTYNIHPTFGCMSIPVMQEKK